MKRIITASNVKRAATFILATQDGWAYAMSVDVVRTVLVKKTGVPTAVVVTSV